MARTIRCDAQLRMARSARVAEASAGATGRAGGPRREIPLAWPPRLALADRERDEVVARDRRDVLPAVDLVAHRRVDDLPAEAGLPEQRTRPRVERVEIAFAAAR